MRLALAALLVVALLLAAPAAARPVEWTAWIGAGGGARDLGASAERAVFALRAGGAASLGLARLWDPGYGGAYELRWGPWLAAETQLDGALGEAGLELLFTQTRHARWGSFALRLGGGYSGDGAGRDALLSLTASGGVRSVSDRGRERGRTRARDHLWASGLRLFVTLRLPANEERGATLLAGVELEPSFLLPPHTVTKWIGAEP